MRARQTQCHRAKPDLPSSPLSLILNLMAYCLPPTVSCRGIQTCQPRITATLTKPRSTHTRNGTARHSRREYSSSHRSHAATTNRRTRHSAIVAYCTAVSCSAADTTMEEVANHCPSIARSQAPREATPKCPERSGCRIATLPCRGRARAIGTFFPTRAAR